MALLKELKRRNVFRAGAAYLVAAWLIVQVAETILPSFGFGERAIRTIVSALAIGLIPVLITAWIFELTPEGFKREREVDYASPVFQRFGKKVDRLIMMLLALGLAYFAFDKFVLLPHREAEQSLQQQAEIEKARGEGREEALVESYGDKSIAVLPFRDMSPEGDQEYFSEGIAEELLHLLARESQIRVISRTSSFAFKDQALEIPEIARRLKVNHVLEGSVRKAGDTVRITVQLIEARSDTHLWSQTWDRELSDILAIQDEVAAAVAASLQTVLLAPGSAASTTKLTEAELEAFELLLKGRYLLNQASVDAYERALPLYERSIEIAPNYAPAHAGLAKVLRQMQAFGALESESAIPRIEAALDRALALNPNDPDALTTRGAMFGLGRPPRDINAARDYWRRALSINPSDGDALRWLGFSYMNEDSVRYLEYIEMANGVAPTNTLVSVWLAWALSRFDRVDEALGVLRDAHELNPENARPMGAAGDIYYQSRQLDRALKTYYSAFRIAPERVSDEISGLGWLLLDGLSMLTPELVLRWTHQCIANNPACGDGHLQKIVVTWLSGRREEATSQIAGLIKAYPGWWLAHARLSLLLERDYTRSRQWFESGGLSSTNLQTLDTLTVADYAFVLQQTGETDLARDLIDERLARIEQQMAAGVIFEDWWELKFYAAALHAMRGENLQSLDYLIQDAENSGLSSLTALKLWPHFDGLRHHPEFQAMLAEQDKLSAHWLQRLEEEGLLMGPEEVLALQEFDFDPFAE
jgi:TolB-like protein/cytochrome c-type biogenesis protein CcmH/NrfG